MESHAGYRIPLEFHSGNNNLNYFDVDLIPDLEIVVTDTRTYLKPLANSSDVQDMEQKLFHYLTPFLAVYKLLF